MIQDNKSNNDENIAKLLGAIIYRETSKPDGECDTELVKACEEELASLDLSATISKEKLDEKLISIMEKTQSEESSLKKNRLHVIKRISAIAACFILVIGGLTLTAYATVPSIRAMILNVLKIPVGSMLEDDGITYVNGGVNIQYSSIDEMIETEHLRDYNLLFPDDLPFELKIGSINVIDYNNEISLVIKFADDSISMEIDIGKQIGVESSAEQIEINGFTVYIYEYNGEFESMMQYGDNTYYITSTNRGNIITIIEHMNKE